MTNHYGELLDVKDIIVSHAGNSSNNDARTDVIDGSSIIGESNAYGELIHECQIVPSRRRKYRPRTNLTREDYYRIRQDRFDRGQKHGEDYDFELTSNQRAIINRWHEIYAAEIAEEDRRFMNRMKRNNNEGRSAE